MGDEEASRGCSVTPEERAGLGWEGRVSQVPLCGESHCAASPTVWQVVVKFHPSSHVTEAQREVTANHLGSRGSFLLLSQSARGPGGFSLWSGGPVVCGGRRQKEKVQKSLKSFSPEGGQSQPPARICLSTFLPPPTWATVGHTPLTAGPSGISDPNRSAAHAWCPVKSNRQSPVCQPGACCRFHSFGCGESS